MAHSKGRHTLLGERRDHRAAQARGELIGFAKVTRDLTERRAAQERALAEARRATEAEVANRTKSEFLAAMSHELRTPLNAIGGYAELIAMGIGGPITEQQQDYLSRIRASQQHLLGIITDLLNFSRIEAGQLHYNVAPVSAQSIIDGVMPLIGPQAEAKKIALSSECVSPLLLVQADKQKAEQIVLNLMSNSIKFTPAGGSVRVRCTVEGAQVCFAVRGQRHWSTCRQARGDLRAVRSARAYAHQPARRHGAGIVDQPGSRARNGRRCDRGEHGGHRKHVLADVAAGGVGALATASR